VTSSALAPALGDVLVAGLLDDAAIYPPGDLPLPEAVRAHLAHRAARYGAAVGPFVCSVAAAQAAAAEAGPSPLTVSLIASSVDSVAAALAAGRHLDNLSVAGVEVPLGESDPADVARQARADGPAIFVEVPASRITEGLARRLADMGLCLKLRTGGMSASAFPSEHDLSSAIAVCLACDLPFKCTAGLHHAVRHRDPLTGFEHHGFLNVLAAVAAGRTGGAAAVMDAIGEHNGSVIATQIRTLTLRQLRAARAVFRSFGTCSIADPLADLAALGLAGAREDNA
jgi:hypothetical protein